MSQKNRTGNMVYKIEIIWVGQFGGILGTLLREANTLVVGVVLGQYMYDIL